MPPTPTIAVVDYGSGNLRSVAKALVRSGLAPCVTGDPDALRRADAVVLPGVGAFADAVAALAKRGLDAAVREWIRGGRPYLGLCLGLQVLFEDCDEHGLNDGLGLFEGHVRRFAEVDAAGRRRLVPHIGWNSVRFAGDHPMCARLPREDCFYFVHSYRALPANAGQIVGTADYGESFAAALAHDNVFAVQFHPEKSQSAGRRVLDAFAGWLAAA